MIRFDSILVICVGNLCRSPMADYALKQLLPGKRIQSAGLNARENMSLDPTALSIAAMLGVDMRQHKPMPLSNDLIDNNDLLLVMESQHLRDTIERSPLAAGKAFLMGHWSSGRQIVDPYRRSEDLYKLVFAQILQDAEKWAEKIG